MIDGSSLPFQWKITNFTVLNLALFVSYGLFSLPGSFLPLYNLDRSISLDITGAILGAVPFCYIFMCPLVAKMLDRWSSKALLLFSTGLVSFVTVLFSLMGYIEHNVLYISLSFVLRICQGLLGGVIDVVAFTVTAKMFPNNIALTTAIVETSLNMAIAASPYIGAALYENVSFLVAFLVPGGAIFLLFLVSFVVKDVDCRKDQSEVNSTRSILTDPLLIFPAWHCAFSQILLNFYIPILAPYTEATFDKGAVFAGICLLINTAGIIIVSPFLGYLMDRFNPYIFLIIGAVTLPVTYLFVGPSPILGEMIAPSPTQLITVLALIGFEMPLACYPSLIIMNDIYKVRYKALTPSAQNLITSIYCGSFPVGAFLGVVSAGLISRYMTFGQSTQVMGFLAILQSLFVFLFLFLTLRLKRSAESGKCGEETPLLRERPSSLATH